MTRRFKLKLGNEVIERQTQLVCDLEINSTADYYNHRGNNQREEAKGGNITENYKERAARESRMRARSMISKTLPAQMMETKYGSCCHTSVRVGCGKLTCIHVVDIIFV